MSIERDDKYYDEIYSKSDEYQKGYEDSVYYSLWQRVIGLVPDVTVNVLDVGCGVGQFAKMLKDTRPKCNYVGFDFSQTAVDQAMHNGIYARKASLYKYPYDTESIVVTLEVMEHIRDFEFLNKIPLGVEVIFTVPDFNDAGHVRYFHSATEVVFRYYQLLQFNHIEKHERWFVCKAVRI